MSKKTCSLRSSSSELHLEITPPPTCVYSETGREEQLIDLKGQAPGDRKLRNDGGSRKLPQRRNSWCGERKAHSSRLQSPRRLRDRRGLGHISARTDDHPSIKNPSPGHFANWHGCSASSFADVGRFYESHHFLSFLGIDRRYSSPEELGDFPK